MARLLALLTTAAAYVTQQPKSVAPGRTAPRSSIVLGPQSVPQVPYSPPGAEQGQHMYVDIYQALYRDRIMLVGNFLDEEQANSLIALLLFMRFEDPRKPISIYFNVPGALMKPCLAVYDTLRTLECPVTTVNLGLATGMGAFLCGAGTKGMRYALPNARFLMQRTGLDDPYQGQASDIGLMVRENLRDNDRMEKALVTMTGHPLEKIKKDMHRPASAIRGGRIVAGISPKRCSRRSRDFYLSAHEAVQYGLIDKVLIPQPKGMGGGGLGLGDGLSSFV
jgi:ATP-dependent Clp protease protease subunit